MAATPTQEITPADLGALLEIRARIDKVVRTLEAGEGRTPDGLTPAEALYALREKLVRLLEPGPSTTATETLTAIAVDRQSGGRAGRQRRRKGNRRPWWKRVWQVSAPQQRLRQIVVILVPASIVILSVVLTLTRGGPGG